MDEKLKKMIQECKDLEQSEREQEELKQREREHLFYEDCSRIMGKERLDKFIEENIKKPKT